MSKGVSVIVCCYNSSQRLPKTLEHLAKQITSDELQWEVVIVNNNSQDNTSEVAVVEWNKFNVDSPLIVVDEPTPGLSAAREKGIATSKYNYLIFCDDDNWLASDYVANAYKILKANPFLAAIGGINKGVFEVEPPKWIGSFKAAYAIDAQGEKDFEILEGDKYVVGAGMAFSKEAYLQVRRKGFKFYLTDRIGNKLVSGGDVELCFLFKLNGYKVAFSSELVLEHYMPSNRITKKYLTNLLHQNPYSFMVFDAYRALILDNIPKGKNTSTYWRSVAIGRVISRSKFLSRFIYHKLRGNIAFYLPIETSMICNFYLFHHAGKVVAIVNDLQRKLHPQV